MSDEHLVAAIYLLSDAERKLEERTFKEMSRLNGLSEDRYKDIYYYAIKKIRKMMGGRRKVLMQAKEGDSGYWNRMDEPGGKLPGG